ncbi:hypothetical protein GCM10010423_65700 [Streptomyces levis]|uniref:Uncharacterized protein n=1 Tax=Streptomyces levis TaxID=285566 RepID=A0ABP6BBZ3_9ACTN
MKMQPSPTQQRKKCCWERGQVNGYQITDFLKRRAGVLESNITSGEPGIHTMYVGRISEAHIRWCGHRSEEDQRLEQFAKILRDLGYTVVLAEENNVDWPPNQPRKFLNHRRNRKFLRVAKFHRKQRQKKA